MQFGGSYKLDNGDGLEDTSDDTHRWEVRTWPKDGSGEVDRATHAAVAVGTTPFGRFVSLGVIDGSTMTLARRYIADDDVRAASPTAVLGCCLDDAALEEEEELAPRRRSRPSFPWNWTSDLSACVFQANEPIGRFDFRVNARVLHAFCRTLLVPKRKRSSCEPFNCPSKNDPSDGGAEAVDQTDEGIDPGGWSPTADLLERARHRRALR